jgi:hypothetical protein
MPAQCFVRGTRNVVRKKMTQKFIAHLAFLFAGRSLRNVGRLLRSGREPEYEHHKHSRECKKINEMYLCFPVGLITR